LVCSLLVQMTCDFEAASSWELYVAVVDDYYLVEEFVLWVLIATRWTVTNWSSLEACLRFVRWVKVQADLNTLNRKVISSNNLCFRDWNLRSLGPNAGALPTQLRYLRLEPFPLTNNCKTVNLGLRISYLYCRWSHSKMNNTTCTTTYYVEPSHTKIWPIVAILKLDKDRSSRLNKVWMEKSQRQIVSKKQFRLKVLKSLFKHKPQRRIH
jgi:hypothetical protein